MTVAEFLRNHPEFRTDGELATSRFSLNAVAFTSDSGDETTFVDLQEGEITDPCEILIRDQSALIYVNRTPEIDDDEPEDSTPEQDVEDDWSFI